MDTGLAEKTVSEKRILIPLILADRSEGKSLEVYSPVEVKGVEIRTGNLVDRSDIVKIFPRLIRLNMYGADEEGRDIIYLNPTFAAQYCPDLQSAPPEVNAFLIRGRKHYTPSNQGYFRVHPLSLKTITVSNLRRF